MNKNNESNFGLNWQGPIEFNKFENGNICKNKPSLNETGLYLFTVEIKEKLFAVTYVGAAPVYPIYYRVSTWYKMTKSKKVGSYLYFKEDALDKQLDYKLTIFDGNEIDDKMIEHNLQTPFIFYCPINECQIKELNEKFGELNHIRELEGALKNKLRRKMESRKYLLSFEHAKYGISDKKIINICSDKDCDILGLTTTL